MAQGHALQTNKQTYSDENTLLHGGNKFCQKIQKNRSVRVEFFSFFSSIIAYYLITLQWSLLYLFACLLTFAITFVGLSDRDVNPGVPSAKPVKFFESGRKISDSKQIKSNIQPNGDK